MAEVEVEVEIPDEFSKIITDFVRDIITTFPEYEQIINKWWLNEETRMSYIFDYCRRVFPERFFDILYKKDEIFEPESVINTEFLPGISFKYLWNCDISETTRDIIWKYLQMILISVIGTVQNKDAFGDTSKIFDNINEDEFKNKLEETLNNIQTMFNLAENKSDPWADPEVDGLGSGSIPSADELHNHINGMIGGKLGELAREIAEETTQELDIDMDGATNATDVFQKLFQNPGKLMNLVKSVGSKLDAKMKNGEMNQGDLMKEAADMLNNMKKMPGMENMQDMFSKMGLGTNSETGIPDLAGLAAMAGLGGGNRNAQIDTNAMEQKMKNIKMREKMKKRMEEKHLNQLMIEAQKEIQQSEILKSAMTDEQLVSMFSNEKSMTKKKDKDKKKNNK
jgi:hypothetical protein